MHKFFVAVNLSSERAEETKKLLSLQDGIQMLKRIGKVFEIFEVLVAAEQLEDFQDQLKKDIIGENNYSSGSVLVEKTTKKEWVFKNFDFELTKEGVRLVCHLKDADGNAVVKFKEELVLKKKPS